LPYHIAQCEKPMEVISALGEDYTMSDGEKRSQRLRFLFAAGVSGIALAVCVGRASGQTSEIDSYDLAVTSQSKTESLSFIRTFGSSHLVGDLIESLPPEVAQQVCAELQGDGPARARKACEGIREALAVQPVAPAAKAPAAGAAADPVSTGADTSAGVSSEEEPAGGSEVVDPVSIGADTSAGVSSDDEPAAGSAVVDPVSIDADTSAGVSSDDEPAGEQEAGSTDTAGDTDLFFYLPVMATAPAAGTPVAEPVSSAVTSKGGQGNGGTDESHGIILQTARTVPTASITEVTPSVSISTSASTAAPHIDDPDTSQTQSSSGQSSIGQGSTTQSGSAQSSSGQSSNTQSGSAQSSSDQSSSGKDKGSKGKGGKGKGDKDKGSKGKGSG